MNKEKEDLVEPLPYWNKNDLKEVVLYGDVSSPPCTKIMSILTYHKIQYKLIKSLKKDSEYQKVPILIINGRQINDSFIIVRNLAKIIDGRDLTYEEVIFEE